MRTDKNDLTVHVLRTYIAADCEEINFASFFPQELVESAIAFWKPRWKENEFGRLL